MNTTSIPKDSVFSHPWWDDAIAQARQLATETEARQRVSLDGETGRWVVSLADDTPRRGHLQLVTDETPAQVAMHRFYADRVAKALAHEIPEGAHLLDQAGNRIGTVGRAIRYRADLPSAFNVQVDRIINATAVEVPVVAEPCS